MVRLITKMPELGWQGTSQGQLSKGQDSSGNTEKNKFNLGGRTGMRQNSPSKQNIRKRKRDREVQKKGHRLRNEAWEKDKED